MIAMFWKHGKTYLLEFAELGSVEPFGHAVFGSQKAAKQAAAMAGAKPWNYS